MIYDSSPTIYIAQVYSCDVYGGANYNECPATDTGNSAGASAISNTNGTGQTSTTTNPDGTTTDPNGSDSDTTTGTVQPADDSKEGNNPADAVAGMPWGILIPIMLVLAVIIAWLILFFKRRRRDNQQLPPPNTPYTPTPGQF